MKELHKVAEQFSIHGTIKSIEHINKGKHALGVDAFRCHHRAHRKIRPEQQTVSVY